MITYVGRWLKTEHWVTNSATCALPGIVMVGPGPLATTRLVWKHAIWAVLPASSASLSVSG